MLQPRVMLASAAAAAALLTVPVAWQRQPPQIEGHQAEDLLAAVEAPLVPEAAPPGDLAQLRERIDRLVQQRAGAGLAVALVDARGTIWVEGFGQAGPDGRRMSADTLFRVGSLTKPFMALAIMRLVEAGPAAPGRSACATLAAGDRRSKNALGADRSRSGWRTCWSTPPASTRCASTRSSIPTAARTGRCARCWRSTLARAWRAGARARGFAYSQPGYTLAARRHREGERACRYERFLRAAGVRAAGGEGRRAAADARRARRGWPPVSTGGRPVAAGDAAAPAGGQPDDLRRPGCRACCRC